MITLSKEPKICTNCGTAYYQRSIRQKYCGSRTGKVGCSFLIKKERTNQYCRDNKIKYNESRKRRAMLNKEYINKKRRDNYLLQHGPKKQKVVRTTEELRMAHKEAGKRYRDKNKKKINEKIVKRARERIKTDINFRLKVRIRYRLWKALKGLNRNKSTIDLLGCSIEELKIYLQNKFQNGMSWNNYGRKGWTIDHILPLTHFNLSNPSELQQVCHYTNLQPLWELENISKGNRVL